MFPPCRRLSSTANNDIGVAPAITISSTSATSSVHGHHRHSIAHEGAQRTRDVGSCLTAFGFSFTIVYVADNLRATHNLVAQLICQRFCLFQIVTAATVGPSRSDKPRDF